MFIIAPFFLLAICAGAYRILSKAAYKKGLNEVAFGLLGVIVTAVAGGLSFFAAAAIGSAESTPENMQITTQIVASLVFLPMCALYIGAIFVILKFCPADAGDVAVAVKEHRVRGDSPLLPPKDGASS